jgi:hypothetical protein
LIIQFHHQTDKRREGSFVLTRRFILQKRFAGFILNDIFLSYKQ